MKKHSFFHALLAASAVIPAAGPAFADVKAGVDAWSAGDYKTAIKEWQGPAARGDPDAQFNLAQAYKLGRGVDQDLAKAESLYKMAAEKGHLQAADNYGLLLFQRGERAKAMPYIHAAAGRGDPRAQYVLGIAYFNGDHVPKDWVRAYALVSLAQQAGLPQATNALAQMDQYIPLEQRQQSVPLASELAQQAATNRASQVAALDLGSQVPDAPRPAAAPASPPAPAPTSIASAGQATAAARAAESASPASAGADYARPQSPAVASPPPRGWIELPPNASPMASRPAPGPAVAPAPKPAAPVPAPESAHATTAQGPWRVQLGAFGVAGNADRLWSKVHSRPELAGHSKLLVKAGSLTKLQAGGFSSEADADSACGRLKAAGISCLTVKD